MITFPIRKQQEARSHITDGPRDALR